MAASSMVLNSALITSELKEKHLQMLEFNV